jgi:hypothetical protein
VEILGQVHEQRVADEFKSKTSVGSD